MENLNNNIERFLSGELAVSLSNIRAHLQWASRTGTQPVQLSPENASSIVASIMRLEGQASQLSDCMRGKRRRPVGVSETLWQLAHGSAA